MTFTMPFDVGGVCILLGPTSGAAATGQVQLGQVAGGLYEDGSTPARTPACPGISLSAGTGVTLSVYSNSQESLVVDGVILVP
jgi:hypothetical protein